MTCDLLGERLDEYLDGTLPLDQQRQVEAHLHSCADCREEERSLRAIVEGAGALPAEVAPARDLWPEIRARLEPRPAAVLPFRVWGVGRSGLAAAAALLMAVAGTWLWRPPRDVPAGAPAPQTLAAAGAASPLQEAEQEYTRATAELMAVLDAQRPTLAPRTVAAVEANLRSIDAALAEIRKALAQDPSNPGLAHMLASTHRRKVDILQRVVRLSRT